MFKKGVLFLGVIASILCALNVYLYLDNLNIRKAVEGLDKIKKKELSERLAQEKAVIIKDLDKEYRIELDSFEAAYKSLGIEKKRAKAPQGELRELEKK